jgi:hypothetical protein
MEPSMSIHRKNGGTMKFIEHRNGLYYFDTLAPSVTTGNTSLLQSVDHNKRMFVKREVEAVDMARDLYRKIGRPSQSKFEELISKTSYGIVP